jgi:hypothetical protein
MKKLILALFTIALFKNAISQCTTTNATSCICADGSNDCDLLPDITISWQGILYYAGGPDEYPQVCNPPCGGNDGRLRITGSTPNIGLGPLTVRGTNYFVCGTDTFQSATTPGNCPDGSIPRQLIKQRIYHKNGNTMTFYDRWAGAMTYHPGHGHNHVDDWGVFTLRINNGDPNPLNWPIVGTGAKLGFCLMDYGQCGTGPSSTYYGHCRDNNTVYGQGNILINSNFPNWGLGGGSYGCSVVEQGISSGWTDVYSKYLDGMWINLPPDLCNGEYWIVVEVDPLNFFLESDETNNYTAVPFTLTQQNPPGNPVAYITSNRAPQICVGDNITLTANAGISYLWSNGATTQSITVNQPGSYTVTVNSYCGTTTSQPFVVTQLPQPSLPIVQNDTICAGQSAILTATGSGTINWYNTNGTLLHTGNTFVTPTLNATTNYIVQNVESYASTTYIGPTSNTIGIGTYNNGQYLIFNASQPIKIVSVLVYADVAGVRNIELRSSTGTVLQSTSVNIPAGQSRVTLNFNVPIGNNYQLALTAGGNLFRNSSGVAYPYSLNGIASIIGSSSGSSFYYYFYDWEIEYNISNCTSLNAIATAYISTPTGSIIGLNNVYDLATFTGGVTMMGIPPGGTFSGPGVGGNVFDPATAGVGTHTITYTFTDSTGCSGSVSQQVTVISTVGIFDLYDFSSAISIFPNPAKENVNIEFEIPGKADVLVELKDILGKTIYSSKENGVNTKYKHTINTSSFEKGVYFVTVYISGKPHTKRLVIE